MSSIVLSVVVPMYNEEAVIPALVERLRPTLDGLGVSYEVVTVDDGSADRTAQVLFEQGRTWPELRLVRLRQNSGHQAALTAGLHRSRGDWVVSIDADLQDPPETIADMLRTARDQGLDVVYGIRSDRSTDTFFKRHTAGAYYKLMRRMVGADVPAQAGDFRLLSREVVDVLRVLPERTPVYRLLVPSLGFASGTVSYVREKRAAGETKYPLRKMVALAWDSAANFSAAPLRLATWLGIVAFVACLGLMVFGLVVWANGTVIPGWTSLFLAVLLLSGVQLICLGLLGEYVARIYQTVQNRPAFHIGFDSVAATPAEIPQQRSAAGAL
ncbi:glycosyltransferase family 2 protein [Actinoplanes sp. N902-109]|uniref:glycosyltransferase family 2 protein n=1 Tax=Actinoplanes sp. (strain N902-109) TaxID=649831 RepID=UPI00032956EE|nr:glycosyltransferase family 2 protein [Actinoplanes sp. N902-109]AGL14134.1 glucosyltransferase [Actinoplanes sp. N902-109]